MEDRVTRILEESEIHVRNKVAVYVVSKYGYERNVAEIQEGLAADSLFYAVEGEKTYTLVAAEKHQELVEDVFQGGFKTKTEDLALVTVTSPERIEGVPGVIAHMLLLLANRDINVVELMSCWTDTLLVVDRADVAAVMDALTL